MIKSVESFQKVWAKPYEEAKVWKENTKGKVVGWFPMYAPEELIAAAGALPVYTHGFHEAVTVGNQALEATFCPPIRLFLDSLMKGYFDVVDGLLIVREGFEGQSLAQTVDLLAKRPAWLHFLRRPHALMKPIFQEQMVKWTDRLKEDLQMLVRCRITDDSVHQQIGIYNKNRALLRQLYDLRIQNPGLLRASEMLAVVSSSMLMPKEKHNDLLQKLLSEVEGKKASAKGVKVLLAGSLCDDPTNIVLDTVEEAGMVVVDDDLFNGRRYFATDAVNEGDPIYALARVFWTRIPCPTCQTKEKREYVPYLIDLVKRSGAQCVVDFVWKYCGYQTYARPYLFEGFKEAGIPYMQLDLAEEAPAKEAIRTRLEAFAETVKGGR